jgi:hypothetical protein
VRAMSRHSSACLMYSSSFFTARWAPVLVGHAALRRELRQPRAFPAAYLNTDREAKDPLTGTRSGFHNPPVDRATRPVTA